MKALFFLATCIYGQTLDDYLYENGFFLEPTHSYVNEGYSSQKQRHWISENLQGLPIRRIMEIGFNAGHSAEVIINATDCEKFVSFDINMHSYTPVGVEFMKKKYGDRFEFVEGNSKVQVPYYSIWNKEKFDLIFIDGGHSYECCLADIQNCQALAHKDTILWVDDYLPNASGVGRAVDFCIQQGMIELLEVQELQDGFEYRSWAIASYRNM